MKNAQQFLEKIQTASNYTNRLQVFEKIYKDYRVNNKKSLKILDIGCGKNVELFAFRVKGDKYYGCDYYDKVNVKLDGYIKIDLNQEKLNQKIKNKKFDVIFCGEVIEHLFSPDDLLDEIKKLMHKDSILILSTPNLGYYLNRVILLFGISPMFLENSSNIKLGRKYKFLGQGNQAEGHIRVFTYGALVDLLKLKEYKIMKIIPVSIWGLWLDKWMSKISKSFAPDNVFVLKKR